jgi:hypothetical protein
VSRASRVQARIDSHDAECVESGGAAAGSIGPAARAPGAEVGALHVTPPAPRQPDQRLTRYRIAKMTMMTPRNTRPGKIPNNAESLSAATMGVPPSHLIGRRLAKLELLGCVSLDRREVASCAKGWWREKPWR